MRTFELRGVMFTCIALTAIVPSATSQYMDGWPLDPRDCEGLTGRFNYVPPPVPGDVLYYVTPLGSLPGGPEQAEPWGINEAGQVTGRASNSDWKSEAFLWDAADGMIGLGDLPGAPFQSWGEGVNNLGHVAGYGNPDGHGAEAFFWTAEGGMIGLGDLPGGFESSGAHAINDLDQVVGGSDSGWGYQAFLWDCESGMRGLGDLPGGQFLSGAWDINNSGQVTGFSVGWLNAPEGFIWDEVNGMRPLDGTPPNVFALTAKGINELGQITGQTNTCEAYLWDAVDGMTLLGSVTPGGDYESHGWDLNDVGQVVGRYKPDRDHGGPFIWDAEHGMRDLADLIAAGTDPDYTLLPYAPGINNAGQIISHSVFKGVLLTPFVLGDLNCDELVDEADVPALLLLLVDPDEYGETYPDCPGQWAGDINQDAVLDPADLYALRDFLGCAPSADPGHYVPADHVSPVP